MRRPIFYILLLTAAAACKEKYDLPYSGPATGYLVVDGMINSGQGPTNIRLSRTLALVDSVAFRKESHANVYVEGDNNSQFQLTQIEEGLYNSPQLNLLPNVKYRLRIRTNDGKVYFSAFTPNKKTPDIDNISWEKSEEGVTLFINTHDPQNNTLYYNWDYEETWEIHSAYMSLLTYIFDQLGNPITVTYRNYDESLKMYTCWGTEKLANILVGSSAKLSRDSIHLPITFIPTNSEKISVKFSIWVKQHAISREGYEFLQKMKKNTEQVGTLFDAQPSELVGNIKCADDPLEIVIGFVEVSQAKEKRIFIDAGEVLPWHFNQGCYQEEYPNIRDSLNAGLIPTSATQTGFGGGIIRFLASTPACVDCRTRGSSTKPSFWP